MRVNKFFFLTTALVSVFPILALAGSTATLQTLIKAIGTSIFAPLIPVMFGLALILFFWGLINYLRAGLGEKGKIDEAKSLMLWGVIILFVMVSVWGLVNILASTFFSGSGTTPPDLPKI